ARGDLRRCPHCGNRTRHVGSEHAAQASGEGHTRTKLYEPLLRQWRVGFNIIYAPFTTLHGLVRALYSTITAVMLASPARLPPDGAVQPRMHCRATPCPACRGAGEPVRHAG